MSLSPPTGGLCSGAAFNLGKPARASEVVDVDGWTVEVRAGQPVIVARGGDEATYADAVQAGLGRAQKALDLMCMRRTNNLATKDVEDEHLTWWASSEGLTVRAVSIATVGTDIPPVTLEVVDAAGNVRPQPPRSQAVWHESFRYFRLSQTTDDLFDAYRNAYLALESVLSSVAPQKLKPTGQPAESESDWFKRALAAAGKLVDLATHAPPDTPDPELRLFEELFRRMRSAMSHAKSGRPVLLPRDEKERADISASLRRLLGLYLDLTAVHLGVRPGGGGVVPEYFRTKMSSILDAMEACVSDDETPFDRSERAASPGGRVLVPLTGDGPAAQHGRSSSARVWSAPAVELEGLPFVRRLVGLAPGTDGTAGLVGVLPGRLVLGTVATLEVMLGVHGANTRQPRARYAY